MVNNPNRLITLTAKSQANNPNLLLITLMPSSPNGSNRVASGSSRKVFGRNFARRFDFDRVSFADCSRADFERKLEHD